MVICIVLQHEVAAALSFVMLWMVMWCFVKSRVAWYAVVRGQVV